MPKMKTHKGAKKRFKLTKSGKIKRNQMLRNHIMSSKSSKKKRQLRRPAFAAPANAKNIKKMLPYG